VYARIFPANAAPAAFGAATAARYACPAWCLEIVTAGVVRDATVVVCETFFAGDDWVAWLDEPPQPTSAREQALAPTPITLLSRRIAVPFSIPAALSDDSFTPEPADEAPARGPAG